jgi:signal transduction histidine kinase
MINLVELLLRIKPEWERAYREYIDEVEGDVRISLADFTRFLEIFLESHLTGESKMMRHLLDEWMQASDDELATQISFEQYQEQSYVRAMHVLRVILLSVAQNQYSDKDLLRVQSAVEQFINLAIEYIAYTEAMENLRRAQRRQREVQEALETLDESRANFVSIAAHGLKTPLTLVEGYSQMIKEQLGEDLEDTRPLLAGIDSGTQRMRELIDDLVDVAMIDNKMLSLYYQPMRLVELIEDVVDQFSAQIEGKTLTLEVEDFEGSKQTVFADRERLGQALVEVIDNAIKYTPSNGRVEIGGRSLPGFLEVSVKDTGVGIDPEDHVRIFEQFGKISEGERSEDESMASLGSGLGLHLSKGILEAHGGAIWVDSPGYDEVTCPGSIFHLMIPAREEPPDDLSVRLLGKEWG